MEEFKLPKEMYIKFSKKITREEFLLLRVAELLIQK